MRTIRLMLAVCLLLGTGACAQVATAPANQAKLPHLRIDAKNKQVRVECQVLNPTMPLEFLCVVSGTSEHEAVLRSPVKPSDLHLALLMLGLEPGEPVRYSPAMQQWLPPRGPPLQMFLEYEKDGKKVSAPAYRWMRNVRTKEPMPPLTWIFAGSRVMEDGNYAADVTGYLVSVVNFDLTVIDIPTLASNKNETLEWEYNPDVVPAQGTAAWMVIEPAGKVQSPATQPVSDAAATDIDMPVVKVDASGAIMLDGRPVRIEDLTESLEQMKSRRPVKVRVMSAPGLDAGTLEKIRAAIAAADVGFNSPADVTVDEARLQALRQRWERAVAPHQQALREAAQTHYEVINTLRREQQRLIDEADRIQRLIDELEQDYQHMTTPRPEP